MRRILLVVLATLSVLGCMALAQTAVTPRTFEHQSNLFLFDNETDAATAQLSMVFDRNITIERNDIVVVGGGDVTLLSISNTFVFITASVTPGGTLQLAFNPALEGNADATLVGKAYWYE